MSVKLGIAAIVLTSALLAFGGFFAMTQGANADGAADPNVSCTSISPCLFETNSSTGAGIKSSSSAGYGLVATTRALGSKGTNGRSALLGQDLQKTSGDGIFNFGVSGMSTNGTGVQGSGGLVGLNGITTSAKGVGVLASTTNTNALLFEGSGTEIGIGLPVFTIDAFGHAVFGVASSGYESGSVKVNQYCGNGVPMFEGDDQSGLEFRVSDCGAVFTTGSLATNNTLFTNYISGISGNTVNVSQPINLNGGFTSTNPFGSGTNYLGYDTGGVTWLYQGYSTNAGKYTIEMGDSGSIYARIYITMTASKVAQQTSTGARVDTYTPQITEPSLEDFGEAQLNDGVATVRLDPRFAAARDGVAKYFVTLTPEGDCRGLYVARRDDASFVVRELQGGQSSIAFTYRIVAKPLGNNSARLPLSTLPYGFEHAVPAPKIQRSAHVTPPQYTRHN